MLYPSIDSLMEKIPSKYLLVTIAAKRAREIQDTNELLVEKEKYRSVKNVGKSMEEIDANLVVLSPDEEE